MQLMREGERVARQHADGADCASACAEAMKPERARPAAAARRARSARLPRAVTPGCCARQSVINRPLHDRHALLDRVLKDAPAGGQSQRLGPGTVMTGRVAKLLPGHALLEGMPQPRYSSRLEDIQEVFEEVMQRKVRARGSIRRRPAFACLQTQGFE